MFMCEDASDTWCWSGEVVPLLGPLYEAVHDKAEIFLIHTTVHDQVMPGCVNNVMAPDSRALHPTSLEVRARMAKMCYMTYPTLSVPYLLDDLGEHVLNAYQADGGASSSFLVDIAGTVAFSQWQQPENFGYMWLDSQADNPYSLPARHQRVMNLIECNLNAVLAAGGVWKKGTKPIVPDWHMSPMAQSVALTGVDAAKGQITVMDRNKAPLTIAVDTQSRIMQGKDHKGMADLQVGQTVSIYYQKNPGGSGWLAQLITIGGPMDDYWYPEASWVPAVVTSIDLPGNTIHAKVTLRVQDCKGMAFWQAASPEMITTFGPFAQSIPAVIKAVTSHVGQVLTIHIDRATEMFLDGMKAQLSDVKVGDRLGFALPNDLKGDDVWLHFVRDYRY